MNQSTNHTTIIEFLANLRSNNIKVWVEGNRLRYHAPKGTMTSDLLSELSAKKGEIIEILGQNQENKPSNSGIYPLPRVGDIPLSFTQQRLWFLEKLIPNSSIYHICGGIRLQGLLNIIALEQSLNEIISRHEILRTGIQVVLGKPKQVIFPSLNLNLNQVDLRSIPKLQKQAEVELLSQKEAQTSFNLAQAPLMKASLFQLEEFDYVLILIFHHLVFDAWSMNVLIKELGILYEAKCQESPSALPKLPLQYADFAIWQRQELQEDLIRQQLSYWKQKLGGKLPLLQLPTDYSCPSSPSFEGESQSFILSQSLSQALKQLSQKQGVTLFMLLLAAFKTLLYRYTNLDDILVGTATAGRAYPELNDLIGCFVNTLVLRTALAGNPSFITLLQRVRDTAIAAYASQDVPFEKLVEELQPERDLSHSPLFQVGFAFYNVPSSHLNLQGLTLSSFSVETKQAKLDLILSLKEIETGLAGRLEYRTDLFKATTIKRIIGHFKTLLNSIVKNPEQPLNQLYLLTKKERQKLLYDWNQTQKEGGGQLCVHRLFENQVKRTPEAIAVMFEDQLISYQELNRQANQLAHYLSNLGIKSGERVGVYLERSPLVIVSILSIFKAGGVYVPLDATYPQERLSFMASDANIAVLLTQTNLKHYFLKKTVSIVYLDQEKGKISQFSPLNPSLTVNPHDLAYIIYTSGSTGQPKGVLLAHQGLSNLAEAQSELFAVETDSRVLQFASISFDASISEIFMSLVKGARLCLISQDTFLNYHKLIEVLQDYEITVLTLPPSILAMLPEGQFPDLQTLIVAGEACSGYLVKRWSNQCRFFNAYGPTEATVCATIAECTQSLDAPSIGVPIANTQVYLLDSYLQPVPIGIIGELYIGGIGVAQGYLNRPELTDEKFIPNPFIQDYDREKFPRNAFYQTKIYKTGDLARYLPDGKIEFLGRIDDQVKIRGIRIELGEIEARICQYPLVKDCVVAAYQADTGQHLVAYLVAQDALSINQKQLKAYLQNYLPISMIPSQIIILDAFPLTSNGKVNRKALPIPAQCQTLSSEKSVIPRDNLELKLTQIWEHLLKRQPISITDDFFDMGGHSLLALQLMAIIEQEFNIDLPLSILFSRGTIEQLAILLRQSSSISSSPSPLVPIQTVGSQPPLFCPHPIGGNVLGYIALGRYLSPDQPFYALEAPGLDGKQAPYTRIPDLAAYYIKAIQTIKPIGPYFLGGHSFGGLVALEMAQQLQKQGHEIAFLVLMDTPAPIRGNKTEVIDDATWLVKRAKVLERFFGIKIGVNEIEINSLTPQAQFSYFLAKLRQANLIPPDAGENMIHSLLAVQKASHQALIDYVPSIYQGKITLLRATDRLIEDAQGVYADCFCKSDLGWCELTTEPVEQYNVPGDHITMLTEPYVKALASQLKTIIKLGYHVSG
ncbi:amino acid adenylation domain-containing protein [Microcystis aeruginosa CS-555/01A07]|uniref:amino acid adenylation domain-containing protein n=1 Tax=Microcystis aeruginosa TaxID=1126 RepID=UPI00232DF92C|nr:amino acid adenylation domain-containing protein [Microcystis aeruginosa]MDB9429192.1 amino acid adenylation domain-containing protein [Microcystis aeruginosa CS-555/01A07]